MTSKDVRDALVETLHHALGRPVVLSNQTVPESEYPYLYYQAVAPYIPRGGANYSREAVPSGDPDFPYDILNHRTEIADATFSIVACSRNRHTAAGYVLGDDEALALAERAQGWFLHTGIPVLRERGIGVVEVFNVADRSALEVDEVDRRWGFDVRLRYKRVDTRRDVAIARATIQQEGG